jgi:undecaprenyl-diphosphatase
VTILHAVLLGIVQGLTEFIPVSSSGHLLLLPWIFGWQEHSLTFDVALHLGTAIALVTYFGRDWGHMIVDFFKGCRRKGDLVCAPGSSANGFMIIPIVLACMPAAVVGILFEGPIETYIRQSPIMPLLVAVMLAIMGLLLYAADVIGRKKRTMEEMNALDWVTIGLAQALALFPGVSRSGATITMGLFRNLKREDAAKFSFLLSAPIIFGAAGMKLTEVIMDGLPKNEIAPFIVGVITATVVGYGCIAFLMNFLKKHTTKLFVWYRIALSLIIFGLWLMR